jgi:hypothetical protein
MPATFFTPASYAELLTPASAARDDIDVIAERAELMVLDYYTETDHTRSQRSSERLFGITRVREVMLDGYADTVAEIDAELLRRLRITIAIVTEHLVANVDVDPRLRLLVRGPRTVSYAGVFRTLPHGWNSALAHFDTSEPLWSI